MIATATQPAQQDYGPPKPPEPRKLAEATGLLIVLVIAAIVLLFVGWVALGVVRRRWIGTPGSERRPARRRPGKDPWFEAGRRADTNPAGEEPYQ